MASNLQAVRAAIEARVNTTAATGAPDGSAIGTIAWDQLFTMPPSVAAPWMKVNILWGEGVMWTGGAGVAGNRIIGLLALSFFIPEDVGTGDLYTMADKFRTAFSRWNDVGTNLQFLAPSGPKPTQEEDAWAGCVVTIPFQVPEA